MKNKLITFLIILIGLITLVSCGSTTNKTPTPTADPTDINISFDNELLYLSANEEYRLNITSNDKLGLHFHSTNESIIKLKEDNIFETLNTGEAVILVTSLSDIEVERHIYIVVEEKDTINLDINEVRQINVLLYKNYSFSTESNLITVTNEGEVKGLSEGTATIKVSDKDSLEYYFITVNVLGTPQAINLIGNQEIYVSQQVLFEVNTSPKLSSKQVTFEALTDNIEVDETGLVKGLSSGVARLKATSKVDPRVSTTFYFHVKNRVLINQTSNTDKVYSLEGINFKDSKTMFSSVEEAENSIVEGTEILIKEGNYSGDINLNVNASLVAYGDVKLQGNIVINVGNTKVNGITLDGNYSIISDKNIYDVEITNNKLINSTNLDSFISLKTAEKILIKNNIINSKVDYGIYIDEFSDELYINANTIKQADTAIYIKSTKAFISTTNLKVMWNIIDNVGSGINLDINWDIQPNNIYAVVRFNELTNYDKALLTLENHKLDLSLNYWDDLNLSKFINIEQEDLAGYYLLDEEIITEANYIANNPVKVVILNPIDEISLGEEYQLQYQVYPKEANQKLINWLISHPEYMDIDQNNKIIPKRTMDLVVSITSSRNVRIRDEMNLSITTDPSLEFQPNLILNQVTVGTTFNLGTIIYPYQKRNDKLNYYSSNEDIASVDSNGNITAISSGEVTITAAFDEFAEITQEFKFNVFDEFDDENVFDFIMSSFILYSTYREWNVFGVNFDYTSKSMDRVSRLLLDDIEINKSLIIPEIYPQIRPGGTRPVPQLETYNDANVVYIVVHETAVTEEHAGARFWAEYLYSEWENKTDEYKSWHFTVDDKEIYQHIPTDEKAYHAGDGSSVAGIPFVSTTTNAAGIGGGNSNGIGIETSVAIGDDIYKIWQRTARLAADLSYQYNLPYEDHQGNVKFHYDFSAKSCPQSMIKGNNTGLFYEMVGFEYTRRYKFDGVKITLTSNDPEYLNNEGKVLQFPEFGKTISYTINIEYEGVVYPAKTLYTYLPGTRK